MIGRNIAHYQILEKVGEGGMGVVYKARDTHLERFVAIKVLPPERVADPERKRRFIQEARTASALNHPNIITVHDIAGEAGVDFMVMEFVEGKTLDQLIGRKGLRLNDTLKYGAQIAAALATAHAAGIIHRDLKPGNVMVTEGELVKVLDFGLAKLAEPEPADLAATGTLAPRTEEGAIVGTAAYMSPEQAQGEKLDARSDIFSFGTVMYEMVTGQRPFQGETKLSTLSAIVDQEPAPVSSMAEQTPPELEKLIARCLRKDPERRAQNMADVKLALEELKEDSESGKLRAAVGPPQAGQGLRPRVSVWVVAALVLVALAAAVAAVVWLRSPGKPSDRSAWVQVTDLPDSVSQPALSPDGRMLTFIRGFDTFAAPGEIYVKMLPDGEPVQLTRDGVRKMSPVFSPDGAQIAYTFVAAENEWDTWVVPVISGHPRLWLPNASGLVWLGRGNILFSEIKNHDIHMAIVTSDEGRGGERDVYVPPSDRGMAHRSYPSPDGKWTLVVEMDRAVWLPCRLVPMDGSSPGTQVGPPGAGCTSAAWSPDGKWMYLNSSVGGTFHIWRQRFPDGQAQQITSGPTEEEGIAVAPDGRSFITAVGLRHSSIWLHDSSGERQVSLEGYSYDPKFTPDGKNLCYRILKGASPISDLSELRVAETDSGRSEPLLRGIPLVGGSGMPYDISPDGQQVVITTRDREGKFRLWVAPLDRRSPPHEIPKAEGQQPKFGAGGEIFFRAFEGTSTYVYRVHEDGTGLRKVTEPPVAMLNGISPDGQWLVAKIPGSEGSSIMALSLREGAPVHITAAGSFSSLDIRIKWSADRRWIFFSVPTALLEARGRTYAVPLPPGRVFPQIPPGGLRSQAELAKMPGAHVIDAFDVAPGLGGVYAFARESVQRNLYRIPLP
jgi:eukaryotic-like serine/threonine-protein kinase